MVKVTRFSSLLLLAFFLMISHVSQGQDLLRGYNLREIKVDQLTDAEIIKYMQQLKVSGVSQEQAEQIAISRGMPVSEIQKLKQRVQLINSKGVLPNNTQSQ